LKDPENRPVDAEERMGLYNQHNEDVRAFFKDRPQDFLDINLKDSNAWLRFCQFIGLETKITGFPWENKTEDIPVVDGENQFDEMISLSR